MFRNKSVFVVVAAAAALLALSSPTVVQAQAPDPATLLYVNFIGVTYENVGGPKRLAVAFVDIVDGYGRPVNDALVVGDWSGCFKQTNDSALTDTFCSDYGSGTLICLDGRAEILAKKSFSCWGAKQQCLFTFTITGVFKNGMTYVPVAGWGTSWSATPCD
jgi:hypothetical protein